MTKFNQGSLAIILAVLSLSATSTGCGTLINGANGGYGPAAGYTQFAASAPVGTFGSPLTNTQVPSCVPLDQPIGFQATGIYMDSLSIYAGAIPSIIDKNQPLGATAGQVTLSTGGTVVGAYQPQQDQQNTLDGNISINITPTSSIQGQTAPGMAPMSNANASGTLTLSQSKLQIIYGLFGLNYGNQSTPYLGAVPFNTPGMTQIQLQEQTPCASSIAISLNHYGTLLYGGRVYLYLNGKQRGDYLEFASPAPLNLQ